MANNPKVEQLRELSKSNLPVHTSFTDFAKQAELVYGIEPGKQIASRLTASFQEARHHLPLIKRPGTLQYAFAETLV